MLGMKERPQRKIYPVGYGMDGAQQYIDQLMAQPQMLLNEGIRRLRNGQFACSSQPSCEH